MKEPHELLQCTNHYNDLARAACLGYLGAAIDFVAMNQNGAFGLAKPRKFDRVCLPEMLLSTYAQLIREYLRTHPWEGSAQQFLWYWIVSEFRCDAGAYWANKERPSTDR